ncbi:hypothetical protein RN001_009108 [Aquatica leii]|uniref:FLYWCH-type domain-containing protein n=1 Tax=Aquatica leii TaxID=1421715 RepID=A0AAN7SDM5_9COLE|nr:hypothetical protein RN001_009108 [Aquatica leii]
MSFVTSNRGGQKFIDNNNFVYVFSKKSSNEEHSICVCKKRGQCKGRIWTIANGIEVVRTVTPHNHASVATRVPLLNILSRMNERARDTEETPQQSLVTNLQNVHGNIMAKLPGQDAIKRTIRRQRNVQGLLELPTDLEHFNIPPQYQIINVENGAFSVAPNLFFQLYTIHVEQYGTVIPAIYALLPNKTKETYQKLLRELKSLIPGLFPLGSCWTLKQQQWEHFLKNLRALWYPAVFHLYQNVWRRVQSEGLQNFALWVRMIPAIAFVPPDRLLEIFDVLLEYENFPPEAQPIVYYFEDIYIGRRGRRQRRPPIFRFRCETCTNQTIHSYQINQFITGAPPLHPNKRYATISTRIHVIVHDYDNRNIIDYLKGFANNFAF